MSLLPAKQDWVLWQGATFRTSMVLHVGDESSPLWDLTGYSGLLEIRAKPKDVTVILTLSTGNGRITLGNGSIDLFISATDTAALTWLTGVYDLTVTAPGGDTDALLYGKFSVRGV